MKILTKPPYKGGNNKWLTEAIFYDRMATIYKDRWIYKPLFTFFDRRDGYRCACDDFIALGDPTGYLWALEHLGDYNHFEALMATSWFPAVFREWQRRLNLKLQAEAIQKIREAAQETGPTALAAAKYLAERGWEPKATKGRPTKAQVDEAAKHLARQQQEHESDAERIGLKLVKS